MGFDGNLTRKQFMGVLLAAGLAPRVALAEEQTATPPSALTVDDLAASEKVLDIALDDAHRRLALPGVKSNVKGYASVRGLHLANAEEPALVFTPQGRRPKASGRDLVVTSRAGNSKPTGEGLAFLSVVELGALIRAKKVSPVELTKVYLDRLERFGDKLKCVVTLTPELALEQARHAEDEIMKGRLRGPLHGVPYGIKDLFAVKGYRTTWGAEAFKDQVIDHDSAVVEKLSDAGAVCLAKLSCGALAYDDVWWGGQTKNPWNTKQGSSGSSAGSACSTAAGLAAFTIGTETLGSIISPSNRCRVTGLRPTYGRVSRFGGMVLTWTMDKVGPICRTAEDCAVVLRSIKGSDARDLSAVDRPLSYRHNLDLSKLRIGVLTDPKENPVETADWAQELKRTGARLEPVKFTTPPEGIWALLVAEAAAFFDELTRTEGIDKIGKLWPPEFLAARYMPAVEYINAHRARAQMALQFEREFGDLDAIVTDHFWDDVFTTCNGTGHPQVIIPWGVNEKNEPKSVSVIGRLYEEGTIASIAHQIQRTRNYHRLRPDSATW